MKNAIALGTFDGIHRGHLAVLDMPDEYNKIAVTFSYPPKVQNPAEARLIMTCEDKCRVLGKIGIDETLVLEFERVKNISAEEFLLSLYEKYEPSLISCGFNYRFGKNRTGTADTVKEFCALHNIEFSCKEPVTDNGKVVSSTYIRSLIEEGKVDVAASLLAESFSFEAEVIKGDQRGRTIGFPTINQKYPVELVKLKFGVYEADVLFNGIKYRGITNIGVRPTFLSDYVISETYIEGFSGDLYGESVRIIPKKFLRGEMKFSGLEELKSQIAADLRRK
ncbi:MAG: riboflavin biosynthesis protein RibF [Clostridia bacterium]|nr:riboflavin biosynthesis protein RibF [Clostridia bacterium]